jgi:hypothetical protein
MVATACWTLYEEIARLAVGNTVVFSGVFRPAELDYAEETSVSEEGSMTDPEFIFSFASVHSARSLAESNREANGKTIETKPPAPLPIEAQPADSAPDSGPSSQHAPAPPEETPSSGVLCNGTISVEQHGQLVFKDLPRERLQLTFDHDAWQPIIHRQPDGRQTLVMRSIKPRIQTLCDIRWEIAIGK